MNLESYTKNQFKYIRAGIARREMFFRYSIMRMEAINPNGIYDGVLGESKPMLVQLQENLSTRTYMHGAGKGSTLNLKAVMNKFIKTARKLESLTEITFEKKTAQYEEGFPGGLSEIQSVTQALFLPLAERLQTFAEKYKSQLGQNYVDPIEAIITEWNEKTKNRVDIITGMDSTRPEFETIWDLICKQLYKNALTILLANIDNPDVLLSYYDENIVNFRKHQTEKTDTTSYIFTLAPSSFKTAGFSFSPTDTLLIMNNSTISIFFYAAPTPDAAQPTQLTEIAAGDELEITATLLGAPANKHLIFVNKDATEGAEVEIALI
jgi:hypothetical protein